MTANDWWNELSYDEQTDFCIVYGFARYNAFPEDLSFEDIEKIYELEAKANEEPEN